MNCRYVSGVFLVPCLNLAMEAPHPALLQKHHLVYVKAFLHEKFSANHQRTGWQDRRLLGFDGIKIPVYTFWVHDEMPHESMAGCIIKNARPVRLAGMMIDQSAVPINRVFLKTPSHDDFRAQILARSTDVTFRAGSLVLGQTGSPGILAILWADLGNTKKLFLTLTDLNSLDQSDPIIDLDTNKEEIA